MDLDVNATFKGLVDPRDFPRVVRAFEVALARSLRQRPAIIRSDDRGVVDDRLDRCRKILLVLLGDLKWSIGRACAHVPTLLVWDLDGRFNDWKTRQRNSYVIPAADKRPLPQGFDLARYWKGGALVG